MSHVVTQLTLMFGIPSCWELYATLPWSTSRLHHGQPSQTFSLSEIKRLIFYRKVCTAVCWQIKYYLNFRWVYCEFTAQLFWGCFVVVGLSDSKEMFMNYVIQDDKRWQEEGGVEQKITHDNDEEGGRREKALTVL